MRRRPCTASDWGLTLGNIAGVAALVVMAAAIGTDKWIQFTVNRSKLSNAADSDRGFSALYTHTRHRGMFRECYPGNDTKFLDDIDNLEDKNCLFLVFSDRDTAASSNYHLKIGLYTSFMAMFIFAEVFLLIAYILGLCLCVGNLRSTAWTASFVGFISAFLFALGMALFHGSIYVETQLVTDRLTDRQLFYQAWTSDLQDATTTSYKESYVAAWVGFVLVVFMCVAFGSAACMLPKKKKQKYKAPLTHTNGAPIVVAEPPVQPLYQEQQLVYYVA